MDTELYTKELLDFCQSLPKVELHAHLNGSISLPTLCELAEQHPSIEDSNSFVLGFQKTLKDKFAQMRSLSECFELFKFVQSVVDSEAAVITATKSVIRDFARDNVRYLELRSTPKDVASTRMTKESYIKAVLCAIEQAKEETPEICVKYIVSIDRRMSDEEAASVCQLAKEYHSRSDTVVGVDLSADPNAKKSKDFVPILADAKNNGLKLALHLAEIQNVPEMRDLLAVIPHRIGHGTFLNDADDCVELVQKHLIPIEVCLTSNVMCQTVNSYDQSHFAFWYNQNHPCVLSTDDSGIFGTSLSREYAIASTSFDLSKRQLFDLSKQSINCIFSEDAKSALNDSFNRWQQAHPL